MTIPLLLVFLLCCIMAVVFSVNALINTLRYGLPYVSTPRWAVTWLQQNLLLTERDVVYELGCGDARVLAALAQQFPKSTFVGIEIQWWPMILAKWRCRQLRNIRLVHGDIFRQDLASATVVYGFFITGFMPRLAAKLSHNLRPGTRVISYGFTFPGKIATEQITNPKKVGGSKIQIYHF